MWRYPASGDPGSSPVTQLVPPNHSSTAFAFLADQGPTWPRLHRAPRRVRRNPDDIRKELPGEEAAGGSEAAVVRWFRGWILGASGARGSLSFWVRKRHETWTNTDTNGLVYLLQNSLNSGQFRNSILFSNGSAIRLDVRRFSH